MRAARFRSGAIFTENQAAQLVAQALGLLGIARGAKAFGKLEKSLFFLFPRFDAELNEFHQNAVVTQALALCHALYLFGDGSGEGYAPPDVFCGWHGIIIHHFGAQKCDHEFKIPTLSHRARQGWGTPKQG